MLSSLLTVKLLLVYWNFTPVLLDLSFYIISFTPIYYLFSNQHIVCIQKVGTLLYISNLAMLYNKLMFSIFDFWPLSYMAFFIKHKGAADSMRKAREGGLTFVELKHNYLSVTRFYMEINIFQPKKMVLMVKSLLRWLVLNLHGEKFKPSMNDSDCKVNSGPVPNFCQKIKNIARNNQRKKTGHFWSGNENSQPGLTPSYNQVAWWRTDITVCKILAKTQTPTGLLPLTLESTRLDSNHYFISSSR